MNKVFLYAIKCNPTDNLDIFSISEKMGYQPNIPKVSKDVILQEIIIPGHSIKSTFLIEHRIPTVLPPH